MVNGLRGDRRVGRALRPRRRGLVQRRRRDDVRRRAGAGTAELSRSTTCGSCRGAPGRRGGSASSTCSPMPPTWPARLGLLDIVIQTTPERLTMDTRRHGDRWCCTIPTACSCSRTTTRRRWRRSAARPWQQTAARRQTAAWLVERAIARDDLAEATRAAPAVRGRAAGQAAADPALPGTPRLRAALPAHRPAGRAGGAGGAAAARAGPGGPVPGSVRVAGRGPGSAHLSGHPTRSLHAEH